MYQCHVSHVSSNKATSHNIMDVKGIVKRLEQKYA